MAELISKEKVIEKIWSVYNAYGNNSLAFSDEKTRTINKACGLVQREVERLPITTEQEIRNKAIEEFVEAIKTSQDAHIWCCRDLALEMCSGYHCDRCLNEFKERIDEIAESMKGEKE